MAYRAPSAGLQLTPSILFSASSSHLARFFRLPSSCARSFWYSSNEGSPSCGAQAWSQACSGNGCDALVLALALALALLMRRLDHQQAGDHCDQQLDAPFAYVSSHSGSSAAAGLWDICSSAHARCGEVAGS